MLVLSRKVGERILIGDDVWIMVLDIRSTERVRLGIEAPKDVAVDRAEVRKQKDESDG